MFDQNDRNFDPFNSGSTEQDPMQQNAGYP